MMELVVAYFSKLFLSFQGSVFFLQNTIKFLQLEPLEVPSEFWGS